MVCQNKFVVGAGHARDLTEFSNSKACSRTWPAPTVLVDAGASWVWETNIGLFVGAGHAREQIMVGHNRDHGPDQQKDRPGHQALRKGRVSLPNHVYLITATTLNRQRFFDEFYAGCAAARCFENNEVLGDARMLTWVLMPDHAHWLLQLGKKDKLGIVVNRLKSSSSRMANRVLERCGMLWEPGYHDHALRADEDLINIARYIIANPLRAGLVKGVSDYPFWNAIWV